jgi:glycosyltransferase involved in cell wall biosynthesis
MTPRLSILICSIVSRRELLGRLLSRLAPQLTLEVEIVIEEDGGESTIGAKRERLIRRANGDYLAAIDDDDLPSIDYCPRILSALDTNPDCVGFRSTRYEDGKVIGDCSYSIRNKDVEDEWDGAEGIRHFKRTPNHLTPIRREFVLKTGFEPWCYGEDRDFERRVFPLLKTEVFIDANLYDYLLVSRAMRGKETCHPDRWKLGRQRRTLARA